jgi:hypothetical protein
VTELFAGKVENDDKERDTLNSRMNEDDEKN